jgi:hypothetical protein
MVPRLWKRWCGLGDLNLRNKTSKLPSFIDRLASCLVYEFITRWSVGKMRKESKGGDIDGKGGFGYRVNGWVGGRIGL